MGFISISEKEIISTPNINLQVRLNIYVQYDLMLSTVFFECLVSTKSDRKKRVWSYRFKKGLPASQPAFPGRITPYSKQSVVFWKRIYSMSVKCLWNFIYNVVSIEVRTFNFEARSKDRIT